MNPEALNNIHFMRGFIDEVDSHIEKCAVGLGAQIASKGIFRAVPRFLYRNVAKPAVKSMAINRAKAKAFLFGAPSSNTRAAGRAAKAVKQEALAAYGATNPPANAGIGEGLSNLIKAHPVASAAAAGGSAFMAGRYMFPDQEKNSSEKIALSPAKMTRYLAGRATQGAARAIDAGNPPLAKNLLRLSQSASAAAERMSRTAVGPDHAKRLRLHVRDIAGDIRAMSPLREKNSSEKIALSPATMTSYFAGRAAQGAARAFAAGNMGMAGKLRGLSQSASAAAKSGRFATATPEMTKLIRGGVRQSVGEIKKMSPLRPPPASPSPQFPAGTARQATPPPGGSRDIIKTPAPKVPTPGAPNVPTPGAPKVPGKVEQAGASFGQSLLNVAKSHPTGAAATAGIGGILAGRYMFPDSRNN